MAQAAGLIHYRQFQWRQLSNSPPRGDDTEQRA